MERQLKLINKRCEGLTVKASEVVANNFDVRLKIDDLRKEKLAHGQVASHLACVSRLVHADTKKALSIGVCIAWK